MKRIVSFLTSASLMLVASVPGQAQSLPVPPQLQQVATIKTQATASLHAILRSGQRRQITAIGQRTEQELDRSFGDVTAVNGPVTSIFTAQQLLALADALRGGQMPVVRDDQMAALAQYMGAILVKAGPTWQRGSSQVDALLTAHQRLEIDALRSSTFARLPHFSVMGFDVFAALSDGSPLGGFFADPGAFALLLSLPNIERFTGVPRRQSQIP